MRPIAYYYVIIILIGFSFNSRADVSGWFVVLDATNGFYASPGVPEPAIAALKQAQLKNYEIKSFAFTSGGEWIVLNDKSFEISDTGLDMYKNLQETYQHTDLGKNINCVAITVSGSYINCYRHGLWGSGGNPGDAWNKYKNLGGSGHLLHALAYGPHESWVLLYDEASISYRGIPEDLAKVLDSAVSNNVPIQCVAFSGTNWICLAQNDWWTSDTNLPAAKVVEQEFKLGQHPKWVAFVPNLGPFNAHKFEAIVRQAEQAGHLAGGYACEVIDHGKVVVALAEGWARALWEPNEPAVKWTVDKPIEIASVSKTITATALLKLWEECAGTSRQFSLDDPFWPYLKNICPEASDDVKNITIRQVLKHRSGFVSNPFNGRDRRDLNGVKELLTLPLAHPPGTFYEYQNINYSIIRFLIEQISQEDYTDYVKTHVLAPMGILDMETHSEVSQRMCIYPKSGSRKSGDMGYCDFSSTAGSWGWYASASDLGKFLEGLRQYKVLNLATTKIMLNENLGWDNGNPWGKGGLDNGPNGASLRTGINYFPDGVEAVILVSCVPSSPTASLVQAWKDARY